VWTAVDGDASAVWATDGTYEVTVSVRNDAAVAVSDVVQVYLHDPTASVARPVQLLLAAPRVDLGPGQEKSLTIRLHADQTSYTGPVGQRQVDSGDVELRVGASSADIRATFPVTMTGPSRHVGFDRVMEPTVTTREVTPAGA
jgi:beta-glucosidase